MQVEVGKNSPAGQAPAKDKGLRQQVGLKHRRDEVLLQVEVFGVMHVRQAVMPKIGRRGRVRSICEERQVRGRTRYRVALKKVRGVEDVGQVEAMQAPLPRDKGLSQTNLEAAVSVTSLTLQESSRPISTIHFARGQGLAKSCPEDGDIKRGGRVSRAPIGH